LAYRGCRRVGYCFGGTVAVELAYTGAPLAAMIFIHGTFRGHASEGAKNVKGKVLILHGAEDKVAPLPEVNKIHRGLACGEGGLSVRALQRRQARLFDSAAQGG
jgi:dienelactone hydrolase